MAQIARPNFRVIAASVQGTSHLRTATPCQDAYAFRETQAGELIVAVADGAGSAAYSDEGAQSAVAAAVEVICTALAKYRPTSRRAWQVVVQSAFRGAQQAIVVTAAKRGGEPRQFAATLVLFILAEEEVICGLIGDCGAVIRCNEDTLLSLCPPQRGEYANTTNFIIQPELSMLLDVQQMTGSVSAAALFSDGLAPLAMNLAENEPYVPFFDPLFAFSASATDATIAGEQLADFLNTDRVNARTDDDKTLLLIQRIVY